MQDLLQSDGWKQFQRALGRRTERVDGVLAIEMPLPFGLKYLYSPRGSFSISREIEKGECANIVERLHGTVRNTSAIFWRAEFPSDQLTSYSPDDSVSGSRSKRRDLQLRAPAVLRRLVEPEWTWRTSLDGTDDVLLARMHEKHRYNIRLAMKRGVVVRVSSPPLPPLSSERRGGVQGGEAGLHDFDSCWLLLQETARRQEISTHPRRYYETMLRELPRTAVYLAEHEGTAIACAIIAHHGDTATYLHGGSSHEHRQHMAPHSLHWKAMRDARDAGMRWYDFGGIESGVVSRESGDDVLPKVHDERLRDAHDPHASRLTPHASNWSGITRFKMGFGGEAVHHPPTRDLVFRPGWYRMLAWLAQLRG